MINTLMPIDFRRNTYKAETSDPQSNEVSPTVMIGGFLRPIGLTQMCLEAPPTPAEADIKNCVIGVIAQCLDIDNIT
jgi:hypothetical protein